MKSLIIGLTCMGLLGCSNTGAQDTDVLKTVVERLKSLRDTETEAPGGKASPTRAQIRELNVAMIQMNLDGEDIYPILLPTHRNGAYVTYGNKFRQSITLIESQITATRGFGTDLISATSSQNDPLKVLTPPGKWPATVTREYRFAGGGPTGRIERYSCALQKGPPATITLAATPFDVIAFAELCQSEAGAIQNLYAADAKTGRVWQSRQYIGAKMPPINLDILEPLTQ